MNKLKKYLKIAQASCPTTINLGGMLGSLGLGIYYVFENGFDIDEKSIIAFSASCMAAVISGITFKSSLNSYNNVLDTSNRGGGYMVLEKHRNVATRIYQEICAEENGIMEEYRKASSFVERGDRNLEAVIVGKGKVLGRTKNKVVFDIG